MFPALSQLPPVRTCRWFGDRGEPQAPPPSPVRGPTPLATEGSPCSDAPSKLNSVRDRDASRFPVPIPRPRRLRAVLGERPTLGRVASDRPWSDQAVRSWLSGGPRCEDRVVLLRKEVIQPHLPVRLPCYDFVPIANPTFDSSLPYGLGHWLRVLPTFVT